ncbi:histone-like nucleoid-structuring protein Lsr2 [Saccharomonospora azurea]|uniref:Lsr2 n=1 Tax=Saccharomonospora azurea NA-128 TaxID=882081 RepID=H8GBW8_9PSEU|nr:Lsr2 family protein [Saccharomonospora azurea]EHY90737.1 Lsr2 [Saccharomonospora azurea NA-128]
MARSTAIYTVDDITGELAHETVLFALDGVAYEIDLTAEHADHLRELLDRYVSHGRRTGGRKLRPRLVSNPVLVARPVAQPGPKSAAKPATKRSPRKAAEPAAPAKPQPAARKAPRPTRRRTKRTDPAAAARASTRSPAIPEVRFSAPEN